MGIWIRSQNREILLEACNVLYDERDLDHCIATKLDGKFGILLGIYPTKERAIEVLDEIQQAIWESERAKIFPNDGYVAPTYEMPAE